MLSTPMSSLFAIALAITAFVVSRDSDPKIDITVTTPVFIMCNYNIDQNKTTVTYGKNVMFGLLNSSQIHEYKLNHIKQCDSYWQAIDEIVEEEEWEEGQWEEGEWEEGEWEEEGEEEEGEEGEEGDWEEGEEGTWEEEEEGEWEDVEYHKNVSTF